jgi:hypothetical protein
MGLQQQNSRLIYAGIHQCSTTKYQYPAPRRSEHAPHTWNPPEYGANTQYVENYTTSPALSAKDVNKLQQLTGTLVCYARAVDPTLIMSINVLASEHSKDTSDTEDKFIKLLKYCNTHRDTQIRYHASDMILYIHSDASYLSEREAKSREGGFFYMGSIADTANKLTNGAILIISTVLKHVMNSAVEAEIGAVFINAKEGAVLRTALEELGHHRPPPHTPLETENTTVTGYINGTIKQKRIKAMDMRLYGIKYRVKQGQFNVF